MTKLIIINGAPGVGKSVVGNLLFSRLDNSAYLDGDDVWRINPFEVNEITSNLVVDNITSVLRNYIRVQYDYVILIWVLHRQSIIDRLLSKLDDLAFDTHTYTLIAEKETLLSRLNMNKDRKTDPYIALDRLEQSLKLNTTKIDTTKLTPEEVVDRMLDLLEKQRKYNNNK